MAWRAGRCVVGDVSSLQRGVEVVENSRIKMVEHGGRVTMPNLHTVVVHTDCREQELIHGHEEAAPATLRNFHILQNLDAQQRENIVSVEILKPNLKLDHVP